MQIFNVKIDAAATSNTIYAGATGKVIRVLGYVLVGAGTVTATWKSGTTALTGAMTLAAGTPVAAPVVPLRDFAHLATAPGDALVLALSSTVQVSGHAVIEVL